MNSHEITFNTNLSDPIRTRADFIYKITPILIYITDTGLGLRPVTDGIDAVLRKIEHWHQGSIAAFRNMYRDEHGSWNGVRWDDQCASVFVLCEADEKKAMAKLLRGN